MEFEKNQATVSASPVTPIPKGTHDLRMTVDLNPLISVGAGEWGHRNWISFTGGKWTASWGKGTVEPGGQDSQIVTPSYATKVDTNYLLKTDDVKPAYIVIRTTGWRTGPLEVLQALMDPARADSVDPSSYSFRLYVFMETGDERYRFLNTAMWIGSGLRRGSQVIYDAYRIS